MACLLHAIPFYLCPYPAKYGNTAYSICRWNFIECHSCLCFCILLLKFDTEIQQILFDSNTTTFFVSGLYIVLFLWISWICFVFRREKRIWKHQNPKHCRLVLQTINKSTKVEGIAIRSIDGIKNGRGVGFSWFNGYLVAAGIHEIEFEFYTYRKFHSHSMKDPIYTKNITMDFLPDAVYNVEARAGCRKFRISRVMGWNR